MSVADCEPDFLANLTCNPKISPDLDEDDVDDWIGLPDEDDNDLSTCSVNSAEEGDIYGPSDNRPSNEEVLQDLQQGGELNNHPEETSGSPPIPKNRSIAHYSIVNGKAVILSLDIETGGEYCGILQLSSEILRMDIEQDCNSTTKDKATNIRRNPNTFNEYVNPGSGAIFSEQCTNIHHLTADHPSIRNASEMFVVWSQFLAWIESNTERDDIIILVAYNGEKCDLKWIWRLTQAPGSPYTMPSKIKYFIDPYSVMMHYSSCKLNKSKSKLDSYELGVVWQYLKNENLNGAHDSLVDTKAQTDIFIHEYFVPFINRVASVKKIADIFTATQQNEWRKLMEPTRPVHKPWVEITKDNNITWEPARADKYTGPAGGGNAGPSQKMKGIVRTVDSLASLFIAIVPLSFFSEVAKRTHKYCYEDWVVKKTAKDRDGNTKKKLYFSDCPPLTDGEPTPGRRHRADNEKKKYTISAGYIICWFAILVLQGAHFGDKKKERVGFGARLHMELTSHI